MKTETKELKLRLDLGLDTLLTDAAKKAGIPKTKLAMQLLTQGLDPKMQVADVLSDRIVGAKAKVILVENAEKLRWLKEDYQVIWFEGFIWFVGKTANGSQVQLERWMAYPEDLYKGMADYRRGCNSAADVKEALERWEEVHSSTDFIEAAAMNIEVLRFTEICFSEKLFSKHRSYVMGELTKRKAAMAEATAAAATKEIAEPTAAEEASKIETPVEAKEVPSSPLNEPAAEAIEEAPTEPLTITKKEFKALYQLDDETFSKLGNKLKTGVTTPDGKTWFKLSQSKVTTANPQVSSTQLTLVLV